MSSSIGPHVHILSLPDGRVVTTTAAQFGPGHTHYVLGFRTSTPLTPSFVDKVTSDHIHHVDLPEGRFAVSGARSVPAARFVEGLGALPDSARTPFGVITGLGLIGVATAIARVMRGGAPGAAMRGTADEHDRLMRQLTSEAETMLDKVEQDLDTGACERADRGISIAQARLLGADQHKRWVDEIDTRSMFGAAQGRFTALRRRFDRECR